MATPSQSLCSTCNKAAGVYDCRGCQRSFCKKHVTEHNLELSKEMDNIVYHHDLLRQQLNGQDETSTQHPLMNEINNWERESVEKIRSTAEKARRDLNQLLSGNKKSVAKQLEAISTQLKTSKEADEYSEKELTEWLHAMEKLKKQLSTPPNVILQKVSDEAWLQQLAITTGPINSPDKFDKVYGTVKLLENGFVAQHEGAAGHAGVRGTKKYSTGIHKMNLKVEKMENNYWMLWGIISENAAMQQNSFCSTSANGWAKASKQVYINGATNNGYNNYDGDIVENDILHLILNCDNRVIQLENESTKKKYSIPIDLNCCPFPWQLHINLHGSNDCIRILE